MEKKKYPWVRSALIISALVALFSWAAPESLAAEKKYPIRPIQVVVAYSPGSTDTYLRPITEKLPEYLGQPLSFVYKPGAGGSVGASFVAKSRADGYTLFGVSAGPVIVGPLTKEELDFTLDSFTPLCNYIRAPVGVAVKAESPIKTIKDLVEAAKASPGKLTYSTAGAFGATHLYMEMFCKEAGIKWTYIPSQGSGPTITALLGGHVNVASTAIAPALPHLRAGTLRALAVYRPTRMRALPDAPTLKELGYPIHSSSPYGILAPKDTPKEVVDTIYQAAKKVVDNHRDFLSERLDKLGAEIGLESPEEYTAHLARQYELFSGILQIVKK